jgi:predicted outer membrane repeat protein
MRTLKIYLFSLCLLPALLAATLTVTNTSDSGADSLRQAMHDAQDGDTIRIDVNGTIILNSHLPDIEAKTLIIMGSGKDNVTISGNNVCRPFKVYMGSLHISSLSIADGNNTNEAMRNYPDYAEAETSGGAIFLSRSGSLHVSDVGFKNNNSKGHGGAIVANGSLYIDNTSFYNNSAQSSGGAIRSDGLLEINSSSFTLNDSGVWGGAIFVTDRSTIRKSDFAFNKSTRGGALYYNVGGEDTHELIDTEVLANIASSDHGGGIYNTSVLRIERSLVSSNESHFHGGGIYYRNGGNLGGNDSVIVNSTISHNTAGSKGGAIYLMNSTDTDLNITHATIVNNVSEGIESGGIAQNVGHLYLKNSLLSNNKMTVQNNKYIRDCTTISPDHFHSNGHNLVSFKNSVNPDPCSFAATDINSSEEQVGFLNDNGGETMTHALLESSLANNAATCKDNNNNTIAEDQRGKRRSASHCDIGAFEYYRHNNPAILFYLLQ